MLCHIPGLKVVADKTQARQNRRMDVGVASVMADIGVIWDALERAKSSDRKALRDAIAATNMKVGERNFFLLRGVKFNAIGDNDLAASIITQIQNGAVVPVWPTEFAGTTPVYPKPSWS